MEASDGASGHGECASGVLAYPPNRDMAGAEHSSTARPARRFSSGAVRSTHGLAHSLVTDLSHGLMAQSASAGHQPGIDLSLLHWCG